VIIYNKTKKKTNFPNYMKIKLHEDLKNEIKGISIGYIFFQNVEVQKKHTPLLEKYIKQVRNNTINSYTLRSLKDEAIFRKFRDFYWHYLNIDPTKTRPSSEALVRRLLAKKQIPHISNIVDLNNWISIDTFIPLGAYDISDINFPLLLRFAKAGELFSPIGGDDQQSTGKEIVLVDAKNLVMHEFPHRDSDKTKITKDTKDMLIIACGVPGIEFKLLKAALKKFRDTLIKIQSQTLSYSEIRILK